MAEKKQELVLAGYIFGIISIVLAFFTPLAGFIFGIIGFVQSKKDKTDLGKKSKKLNIIGIILSIIIFIITIVSAYFALKGMPNLGNFPTN